MSGDEPSPDFRQQMQFNDDEDDEDSAQITDRDGNNTAERVERSDTMRTTNKNNNRKPH